MPLDAVTLTALRGEMEMSLLGAKIDRITMPERDLVIFSLHTKDGKQKLLLSARAGSARLHFTAQSFENPPQPPMFCMLLRKHLSGARIAGVYQPYMERLIALELDAPDELGVVSRKRLVLELMGKCRNLVLVGSDGRVIDCLHRADFESNERRPLLPGLFYQEPPAQDKPCFFVLDTGERQRVYAAANAELPPDKRLLEAFSGLSPLICRELAAADELDKAMEELAQRVEEQRFQPVLLREEERPRDFTFLPLRQYGTRMQQEVYESFSMLLDAFYTQRDKQDVLRRRSADLMRTAKTAHSRLLRKLAARQQELEATEKREEYRRRGDLITANMYRLKKGMRSFETQDFYAEDCPVVTVPLDPLKTPQQNAALCYKQYNKAKTAHEVLTGLIEKAQEELVYLESVIDELERAECERDLGDIRRELIQAGYLRADGSGKRSKAPAPRRPMRFVSDSGVEILVGRGNTENDELTGRLARRTDVWFHVQKQPGSHVVACLQGGELDEVTRRQAAVLAATFSRAQGKTAVDYTQVRHVKKPAGARPGRVLYTDYATLLVEPDAALAQRLRREA